MKKQVEFSDHDSVAPLALNISYFFIFVKSFLIKIRCLYDYFFYTNCKALPRNAFLILKSNSYKSEKHPVFQTYASVYPPRNIIFSVVESSSSNSAITF